MEPVTAGCGHTFCKCCCEGWRSGGGAPGGVSSSCPTCGKPLPDGPLAVNVQMQNMVAFYCRSQH